MKVKDKLYCCDILYCLFSEEAEALAKRLKLRFYRASVKEDLNVNEGDYVDSWFNFYANQSHSRCSLLNTGFLFLVFKYLAEKYLQRLKQQTAEETEVVHITSNKIGKKTHCTSCCKFKCFTVLMHFFFHRCF